jgi:hypothetical protein
MFKSTKISEEIVNRVDNWLENFQFNAPDDYKKRIKYNKSIINILKAMIGFFVKYEIPESRNLIVFQGIRNKNYIKHFDPKEVIILGSSIDREYAKKNNFKFWYSFPINAALNVSKTWKIYTFINFQINKLKKIFEGCNKIFIFIYEDTQNIGATLSVLHNHVDKKNLYVVCIQHGYYPISTNSLRKVINEGGITKYNFLWDYSQYKILGCDKDFSFEIGPPIKTRSKPVKKPIIVLIGSGDQDSGSDYYNKLLDFYLMILKKLPFEIKEKLYYRPHPNEVLDSKCLKILKSLFNNIDLSKKKLMLSSDSKIIFGSVSSLLFEAKYCGHIIGNVNIFEDYKLSFNINSSFNLHQVDVTVKWLVSNFYNPVYNMELSNSKYSFLEALELVIKD